MAEGEHSDHCTIPAPPSMLHLFCFTQPVKNQYTSDQSIEGIYFCTPQKITSNVWTNISVASISCSIKTKLHSKGIKFPFSSFPWQLQLPFGVLLHRKNSFIYTHTKSSDEWRVFSEFYDYKTIMAMIMCFSKKPVKVTCCTGFHDLSVR